MGFQWTARRTLLASGGLSALLGAALIALAFLPAVRQAGRRPRRSRPGGGGRDGAASVMAG